MVKIESIAHLAACYDVGSIYRRVETHIEWWEDLVEHIEKTTEDSGYAQLINGERLHVEATMTREQWRDFAKIILKQEGE